MVRTELSRQVTTPEARGTELETLTRREKEVLSFIAQGLSNGKIAANLFIAPVTVEHHITHAYEKLHVNDNDTERVARVDAANKYIDQDPDFNNPFDGYVILKPFTRRENEILILIAQGLSNRAIAKKLLNIESLNITERTVETHISHILTKIALDDKEDYIARVVMMLVSKAKLKVPIKQSCS